MLSAWRLPKLVAHEFMRLAHLSVIAIHANCACGIVPAVSQPSNSRLTRFSRSRPLAVFFLVAYAWSWSFWLLVPRTLLRHEGSRSDVVELGLFLVGACGPSVAALVTQWLASGNLRICYVWTGWKPLLMGAVAGVLCFVVATVIGPALALVHAPFRQLNWPALAHLSTYGVNYSTFVGGPINEEPGWRGFALPRLQEHFGPYLASLILAILWAGWHIPLFYVQGWTTSSPWQLVLILIGVSFLLTAAANLSQFNILVAILLHALFNTSAGLVNALTHGLPPRAFPQTSYALTVLLGGVVLGTMSLAFATNKTEQLESISAKSHSLISGDGV
jgi:uncharacterized protein